MGVVGALTDDPIGVTGTGVFERLALLPMALPELVFFFGLDVELFAFEAAVFAFVAARVGLAGVARCSTSSDAAALCFFFERLPGPEPSVTVFLVGAFLRLTVGLAPRGTQPMCKSSHGSQLLRLPTDGVCSQTRFGCS